MLFNMTSLLIIRNLGSSRRLRQALELREFIKCQRRCYIILYSQGRDCFNTILKSPFPHCCSLNSRMISTIANMNDSWIRFDI